MPSAPETQTTHADVLLQETQNMLAPLARMLVAHGVTYPQLAQALKPVFLEAARAELDANGKSLTDSALSILSGVHRKDVRVMAHDDGRSNSAEARTTSRCAQIVVRWASDPKYLNARGRPRSLPIRSENRREKSFETLVRTITTDYHPSTILAELIRLGLVAVKRNSVSLRSEGFIPHEGFAEMAYFLALNVRQHLAAASSNVAASVNGEPARFLEHASFVDEISPAAVAKLKKLAMRLWLDSNKKWVRAATALYESEQSQPIEQRFGKIHFGAYCHTDSEAKESAIIRSADQERK